MAEDPQTNTAAHDTTPPANDQAFGSRDQPVYGEVDTELRRVLKDPNLSAFKKYMWLTVGRASILALLKFELLTGLLGSLPGAAGLVLRQKLYRSLFGRCGRGVVIGRNVTIRHPHRIVLGDNVVIDDHAVLDAKGDADVAIEIGSGSIIGRNTVLSCKGGTVHVGQGTNLSVNCTLISETRLSIGDKVLIAGHCYIIAGGNHGIDRTDVAPVDQPCVQKGGVSIENHCWLGAQVTVLDGVTIKNDTVVAAGAVVTKPTPAFAIVGGVPARVLRDRRASEA